MAKNRFLTIDGVYRTVTDTLVTVDGLYHKIKKAYMTIAGVYRHCWGIGDLEYYGSITPMSVTRDTLAATFVGNYALFGGGRNASTNHNAVDAYDLSLTRSTPTGLLIGRPSLAAATVGNYALFAGGITASGNHYSLVCAYDLSLTQSLPTTLSVGRGDLAATAVGKYAIFAGGRNNNGNVGDVDAYDLSLTRSLPTGLSTYRSFAAAAPVSNYAIFAGGLTNGAYNTLVQVATVDAYDLSLTRRAVASLSTVRPGPAATSIGNYALFAGSVMTEGDVVDAYDASLTRSAPTPLSLKRRNLAAATVDNYALFGGGGAIASRDNGTYEDAKSVVDVYDASLTRSAARALATPRSGLQATTAGHCAFFAGGHFVDYYGSTAYLDTVEVYTV